MPDKLEANIYRDDHATSRSITLTLSDDYRLCISAYDIGSACEHTWGSDDYQFWVDVEPEATKELIKRYKLADDNPETLFNELVLRYKGHEKAVTEFRDFCEEHKIAHEFQQYM